MPGEFAAWVGSQGGRYNARTHERVTDIHMVLPPAAAREGVARLQDLLIQPCLDEANVGREVSVLDAEFKARLADPAFHRQAALSRFFLPSHPAYICHAGNQASLDVSPRELRRQLVAFHEAHYRSERMSLVMLGPIALEEQLSVLRAAGRGIPSGASPLKGKAESWRWGDTAQLQWCLPEALPERSPILELIWPLPPMVAEQSPGPLGLLVSSLCDGALAQTLLDREAISDMSASLAAEAVGTGLSLALTLRDTGKHQVDQTVATCQAAVQERLAHVFSPSRRHSLSRAMPAHLDQWTLDQARRLAQRLPPLDQADRQLPEKGGALSSWLVPAACRVLEEVRTLESSCRVPETQTRYREIQRASSQDSLPCATERCLRTAPAIAGQPPIADDAVPSPGLIETRPVALWWGGGPEQKEASWCLGWSAPLHEQRGRLMRWRQWSLAARQAARTHGVSITLGGDGLGDWVVAKGPSTYLESSIAQVCATWPARQEPASVYGVESASSGLLAQRLLAKLETAPVSVELGRLTRKPTLQAPARLSWVNGELSATQAREGCRRLASLLPSWTETSSTHEVDLELESTSIRWVPPQAEDYAVMLQIEAADASPTSRLLMKLLEWCHDAAFFKELRQQRGLGYIAAVRYREINGWPRLGYVVQSPHTDIEELQKAITEFIDDQAEALAAIDIETMEHRRGSLRAIWGPPETTDEATLAGWHALRVATCDTPFRSPTVGDNAFRLAPWERMDTALESLTPECLASFAEAVTRRELAWTWWAHVPSSR